MALRTRTVTGTITDAEGTPINGGQVSFTLDKPIGYTDTHVVVDPTVFATTDSSGEFTIDLWCDEDSSLPLNYTVLVPIADSGAADATHKATISLAYEDGSDKDIGTLIAESQPPPSSVPVATWQSLIDGRIQSSDLDTLADVDIDPMTLANGDTIQWDDSDSVWKNVAGGGGGVSIGDAVGSGTAGSVLFVGSGNDLQQDNTNFLWDTANGRLRLKAAGLASALVLTSNDGDYGPAIQFGWNGGEANGARIENGYHGRLEISAPAGSAINLGASGGAQWKFAVQGYMYEAGGRAAQANTVDATTVGLGVILHAAQTANAFEIVKSSNVLSAFDKNGAWVPPSLADSSAANGSVYYSTDSSKLVFKDSGGTVHDLY